MTDRFCRPIAFLLTGGQVADCTAALLEHMPATVILHGDKGYDSNAVRAKIDELSTDGDVVAVCYNNRSAAPLDLLPAQVEVYYAAYRRLSAPYRAPEVAVRVRLEPGDPLVTFNTRVLQGREAFEVASGRRHIQGCYVDRDGLDSRLRVLGRRLGGDDPALPGADGERT